MADDPINKDATTPPSGGAGGGGTPPKADEPAAVPPAASAEPAKPAEAAKPSEPAKPAEVRNRPRLRLRPLRLASTRRPQNRLCRLPPGLRPPRRNLLHLPPLRERLLRRNRRRPRKKLRRNRCRSITNWCSDSKRDLAQSIIEATLDRKQAIILVAAAQWLEISKYCRDEEKFDYLADLTAVDWPKREKRFDLVANLYSFAKNERLRLKAHLGENETVSTAIPVWPVANWLEREIYDMFGIRFDGHPDLRRILLPEEWVGYPLRKDYDILTQDKAWVKENLGIESGQ